MSHPGPCVLLVLYGGLQATHRSWTEAGGMTGAFHPLAGVCGRARAGRDGDGAGRGGCAATGVRGCGPNPLSRRVLQEGHWLAGCGAIVTTELTLLFSLMIWQYPEAVRYPLPRNLARILRLQPCSVPRNVLRSLGAALVSIGRPPPEAHTHIYT